MLQLPKTMKAAQASDYGSEDQYDKLLSVEDDVAVPNLQEEYPPVVLDKDKLNHIHPLIRFAIKQDRKTHMIIKTLAVALAPGDCRVLSGKTKKFQGPPSFPYIPGGDCCGIVVETNQDEEYFQPGDVVAARFTVTLRDTMAEYGRVSSKVCEKVKDPSVISPVEAAALASASPALMIADYIRKGERVLILGAGGGVGSHLCQLARLQGASFICGTSSSPQRLLDAPLKCDDAVNYTLHNVFESVKYQQEPFDTVIDLACGGWPQIVEQWRKKLPSIIKPASEGGRFLTICPDKPEFEAGGIWKLLSLFLLKPLWRSLWTRLFFFRSGVPKFVQVNGLPETREVITRTLQLAQEGKLKAVVDGPHPMTTPAVQQAFRTVKRRHGKGKVVVKVADLPSK